MGAMARAGSSPGKGGRNPGSQPALRRQNTHRVLEALAQGGPTTQAKLARATGLSTGTISNIVKDLDADRRIVTRPVIDSGRRAIEIALNDARVAVGIDIDATAAHLVITTADHTILAEQTYPLPARHTPVDTLRQVRRWLDELLAMGAVGFADVIGAGVSIPTILDERRALVSPDPRFPLWEGHDLAEIAETTFPFPVTFENDANLQALAQVTWGPYSRRSVLATVKADQGIGAGLIVEGKILRGAFGGAGELGHLQVNPQGERCACGNRGCLQTVAGTGRLLAELRRARHLPNPPTVAELVLLAQRRDAATIRLLDEAGSAMGQALASLVTLVNPRAVVISGPLAPVGSPLLDPIGRAMSRHAHPAMGPRTVLAMSQLGDRAEALGAAALAAHATAPVG